MSAIFDPPFWKMEIQCQIRNQRPQKLLSTEFRGNHVICKIACPTYWISAILQRVSLFEIRGDNFFLAVQLFRSPLIIVRIETQYSFSSKKNYEKKKILDFLVLFSKFGAILDFLLDQTQFWPRILGKHTKNCKETWFSFGNFSFSVMRMRLEHKLQNCSSWTLMG